MISTMALVTPASYPASSEQELNTPKSPGINCSISLRGALVSNEPASIVSQASGSISEFAQNQSLCSVDTQYIPRHTEDSRVISGQILDGVDRALEGQEGIGRKVTLQSLRQVGRRLSALQSTKSKWADPEASIGKFCGMKDKYSCWEAAGPAQDVFERE